MAKKKRNSKPIKKPKAVRISMRPYTGQLWAAPNAEEYQRSYLKLFGESTIVPLGVSGRFASMKTPDGTTIWLIYGGDAHYLAHEVAHVVLELFDLVGINPILSGGEPFCYMLSQILRDIAEEFKRFN